MFDSRLGRWLSLDPLAAKYPSLSPYNFVANSPILFIDPDGKEIKIHGNIFFKGAAFMDLQKLTNTKLVLLKDGTVKKYSEVSKKDNIFFIGTPNTTKNLKEGTRLVDKLIKSTKTVDIDYDENRSGNSTSTKYAPASEIDKNGKPGMGTGSRIEYDPTATGSGIKNVDGTTGRPSYIGLGHELEHAESMADGKVDNTIDRSKVDPDGGGRTLDKEEIKTRQKDSQIRKEQGVVERAQP